MSSHLSGPRFASETGRAIPSATRGYVLERDKHVCQYCGIAATDLDHVYPWSNGGTNAPTNLVAACGICNSIAGARVFTELAMKKLYVQERRRQLIRLAVKLNLDNIEILVGP
jgi:5-methylcytosine-specific restriction endonuclease McrA